MIIEHLHSIDNKLDKVMEDKKLNEIVKGKQIRKGKTIGIIIFVLLGLFCIGFSLWLDGVLIISIK